MSNSFLFKVKVRDYIPLTAGHGDEVKRKEKLLEKILESMDDDSGNPESCLDKHLSLNVRYNLFHDKKNPQRCEKDLDNLLKLLLDVLPQHMDNTPPPKPKGLGLMRDNHDKMIFEINCSKKLVEDESNEGIDIEIKVIDPENNDLA